MLPPCTLSVMDDAGRQAGTHANDVHASRLTVDEAAARLDKSPDTVRRYIRAGHLPAERVQGERTIEYRVRPADVDDLHGRQDAVHSEPRPSEPRTEDGEAPTTPATPATAASGGRVQAGTDARMQTLALMHALVEPLVEDVRQARQELGDTREELGRERALREAADARVRALERQTRSARPWWVRMLLGRS